MENNTGSKECFKHCSMSGMIWWSYLVVAVLAVPSAGFLITHTLGVSGIGELFVFILACWFCTFMGMRLMANPKIMAQMNNKKD
jgi:hypothetical protein